MVVDDEPAILVAVQRILGGQHEVFSAESGTAALHLLETEPAFDLIFCDLMMPQMTGTQFHEQLVRRGRGEQAQIVFVTGGAFTPTAQAFLASVPNPWVEKPFDIRTLRALVDAKLGPRRAT